MALKRYGGDIERKNLGGGEKATGFAFVVAAIGSIVSFINASYLLFVASLIIPLVMLLAINGFGAAREKAFKKEQYTLNTRRALVAFRANKLAEAAEHIEKAREYNILDDKMEAVLAQCRRAAQKS